MGYRRGHARIHFLPVKGTNRTTTKREEELEQSEARAHAATVSSSWKSCPRQPQPSAKNGPGQDRRKKTQRPDSSVEPLTVVYTPIERGNSGRLDPFIQLAADLSRQDRDLIHFCRLSRPPEIQDDKS
jgi:hypothetical protein